MSSSAKWFSGVLAAALAAAALALLTSCGSDDGGSPPTVSGVGPTAPPQAPQVARDFLQAAKSGHGAAACDLLTDQAAMKIERYVEAGSGSRDCARYFSAYQTSLGGALPSLRIGRVVTGPNRGAAEVLCPQCTFRPHPLRLRKAHPLRLGKAKGNWRVAFDFRRGY